MVIFFLPFLVSTIFWWDNFNRNVETSSGTGSIHNTPGIAVQEESTGTVLQKEDVSIPKTKRRWVKPSAAEIQPSVKIRSKVSPPSFAGKDISQYRNDSQKLCEKLLLTWKSVRYLNSRNQRNPRFVGWIVHKFQRAHSEATKITYLPPIWHQSSNMQQSSKCFMFQDS